MLGVGAKKKTYLDDVFSTYLYKGTSASSSGSGQTITNGIDIAGEGGLVWLKDREANNENNLSDTVNGAGKRLQTDGTGGLSTSGESVASFTNSGFTLPSGWNPAVNSASSNYVSWTFRKSPMFDIVTYTGNGSARTISHSLGSVPGFIMVKQTSSAANWTIYHRDNGNNKAMYFTTGGSYTDGAYWNNTTPTASVFSLGNSDNTNKNGEDYVAYVFAGGESTATNAYGLGFNGNGEYLEIADHADFDVGTNWTAECWFYADSIGGNEGIFSQWDSVGTNGWHLSYIGSQLYFYTASTNKTLGSPIKKQWHHVAISKEGSTTRIFLNGIQVVDDFDMGTVSSSSIFRIGRTSNGSIDWNGEISNVRIVKGTAVYTSSFIPPTEPLTNITNTVLLCCNSSTATGSTVTPGTITQVGNGGVKTVSPFDDPAGFVFGENGDQNAIKCGSFVGNGNDNGPEVNLGFEPQYLLIRNNSAGEHWWQWDVMRGINSGTAGSDSDGGKDRNLYPNLSEPEENTKNKLDITSTGFKIKDNDASVNNDGDTYLYVAIRRPDPLVQKPQLATDVFAMDVGNDGNPCYDSGFPVDMAITTTPASGNHNNIVVRHKQKYFLRTSSNDGGALDHSDYTMDNNVGWGKNDGSGAQSWMWKRSKGFDVVIYEGNQVGRTVKHNLNAVPEMIWSKDRTETGDWLVYHKGLNSGTNPATKFLYLNKTDAENGWAVPWNNTEPTSVGFPVHASTTLNKSGNLYMTLLFASVNKISKCGSYTGDANANDKTISCGFTPRFVLAKCSSVGGSYNHWYMFDSVRGAGSGNDKELYLNSNTAQLTTNDTIEFTSDGFIVKAGYGLNENPRKYVYYAHA